MLPPAITNSDHRVDRRVLGLGLVALLALAVGFIGQGSFGVGATTPTAVGVVVTDVVGGAGSQKPVRVTASLAVSNLGVDQIRVLGTDSDGSGTAVLNLAPPRLLVDPNAIGRIDADATLDCDRPELLQLPQLRVELRDGTRRGFPIGGSGMLLEACSRAEPAVRPLIATIPTPMPVLSPGLSPASPPSASAETDGRLTVHLRSPTGRRIQVLAVRAGGAALTMSPTTVMVAGNDRVVVLLAAPKTCPTQWQVAGIPSALTVDLVPIPGPEPSAAPSEGPGEKSRPRSNATPNPSRKSLPSGEFSSIARLRLGRPLTTWLLATSCSGRA